MIASAAKIGAVTVLETALAPFLIYVIAIAVMDVTVMGVIATDVFIEIEYITPNDKYKYLILPPMYLGLEITPFYGFMVYLWVCSFSNSLDGLKISNLHGSLRA